MRLCGFHLLGKPEFDALEQTIAAWTKGLDGVSLLATLESALDERADAQLESLEAYLDGTGSTEAGKGDPGAGEGEPSGFTRSGEGGEEDP